MNCDLHACELTQILGTTALTHDDFKPSRRVRSVPGGAQTFTLGDGSDEPLESIESIDKVFTIRFCLRHIDRNE